MRRAKMKESKIGCVRCLLRGLPCYTGTLKGNCISCGTTSLTDIVIPFDEFFNEELGAYMLSLEPAPGLARLSPDEDVFEINIETPNPLPKSHRLYTQSGFLPSSPHLKYQMDQIIWLCYIPNIRCRSAETSLITSALFGRGYLAILCPNNVVTETETSPHLIRLCGLILTRLDESISEVVNAFNRKKTEGDERYWSEVSAAIAILYPGLVLAVKGLKESKFQPLCGGAKLAGLLAQRIESTLAHLTLLLRHPGLSCDPGWASILSGPVKDLRSNVKISSLDIRVLKQTDLMSTRSLSATSSGSTSISTSTPLTTIYSSPIEDPGTGNSFTSVGTGWLDTGPIFPSSPSTKWSGSPFIEFQDSDLFNLIPPSPTNSEKQNTFSPTFSYGNTFTVSEPPLVPTNYTSQGNGYSDFMSPNPLPKLQILGMSFDIPSETEQNPSHVSGPLTVYGTREETSVMAFSRPVSRLASLSTSFGRGGEPRRRV